MKLFLSYSSSDQSRADAIRSGLLESDIVVFQDRHSLRAGEDFHQRIFQEIASCDYVLVLWSSSASDSIWVTKEITAALELKKAIVPVAVDDTPPHPLLRRLHAHAWGESQDHLSKLREVLKLPSTREDYEHSRIAPSREKATELYREKMATLYKNLKPLGAGPSLPIEDGYLPLTICREVEHGDVCAPERLLAQPCSGKTVILGLPGTGKTTLLQFLVYECSARGRQVLPILVPIRDLLRTAVDIERFVADRLRGLVGARIAAAIVESDEHCKGSTLLLLDGVDEIPEQEYETFLKHLRTFINRHPECSLVLTSRLAGFVPTDFTDFFLYKIQPLQEAQMKSYIDQRCPAESRSRIWSTIRSHDRLFELAQTPFLLALMCSAPDAVGVRATQRATLFESCIRYLLHAQDWESGRQLEAAEAVAELEKVFRSVAVRCFKLDFAGTFDDAEIRHNIARIPGYRNRVEETLGRLLRTGLLQGSRDGYYFIHRSIWEYFVAQGMRDESLANLFDRANLPSWEEPTRLFVGLTSEANLESVLEGLWQRNRGLTLRCMSELAQFPDQILKILLQKLSKAERLRIVGELQEALAITAPQERHRLLLDTLSSLCRAEKDCEVLYPAITMLEDEGSPHARDLVTQVLDLGGATERLARYLTEDLISFHRCPPGRFVMGSDDTPDPREQPAHPVSLAGYFMATTLVTNELYYGEFPYSTDRRDEYSSEARQPVNNVSWFEAQLFARWLGCDLPTEAEWEYACRSGGRDDIVLNDQKALVDFAWYGANSDNRTHRVAQKKPNSWGLFDMHGNLREWCKDWHDDNYYRVCVREQIVANPQGPSCGVNRVLRGGTFDWAITNLRPTYRNHNPPNNVYFANGFRLVCRVEDLPGRSTD